MRVLMLVATSVATDTRVLREAATLVGAGHTVHIVGRSVPETFTPPEGITVSSVGTSSVFRKEGGASLSGRPLPAHLKLARWLLMPRHRASSFGRWATGAVTDGATREFDVVHAHDFTALEAGRTLAQSRGVQLVYDSHEFWSGRPREYRPTPLADRRELADEARLGGQADAIITVGQGVADALTARFGWPEITVVRNTFPLVPDAERLPLPSAPTGLVYAGRLAAFRELEVVAAASREVDLPITLLGPADDTWLTTYDPGRATVLPPRPVQEVDDLLAAAGLVLVTHSDGWENHRLALPNKLFHAVRVGAPVVATDVGELARTVRDHGLGTLYRPGDPVSLARAIRDAVAQYDDLRARVEAARRDLCWEVDAQALLGVYARLDARSTREKAE